MSLVSARTRAQKSFYRYTFDIRYRGIGSIMLHTLTSNPEDFSFDEVARNSITQTLGGAYITDFGKGLPSVTMSGTTGYKVKTSAEGRVMDGYEEFVHFRNAVYRGFIESPDLNLSAYWYNWEDDEYYEIQPQDFRLQRNKSQSLLYRYEFKFTCIRKLTKSRGDVLGDYLLSNPSTRDMVRTLGSATSTISEVLTRLTGKGV